MPRPISSPVSSPIETGAPPATPAQASIARRPIRQLPPAVANQIAAGEVIERPAAVVKEALENSLDAGATRITIELIDGGKRRITIADNGHGIPPADLPLAFAPHATSKIEQPADLFSVRSFGFRGEALASIGAVATVTLTSRVQGAETASCLTCREGVLSELRPAAAPVGTVLDVRQLFASTPVRLGFLKGASAELARIVGVVATLATAHPTIGVTITHQGNEVLAVPPGETIRQRLIGFGGREVAEALRELFASNAEARLEGFICEPSVSKPNTRGIALYLNRRPIRDRALLAAIAQAYHDFLPPGRHPIATLLLTLPPEAFDVNVHPQKIEVRFKNPRPLFALVKNAVRERLMAGSFAPRIELRAPVLPEVGQVRAPGDRSADCPPEPPPPSPGDPPGKPNPRAPGLAFPVTPIPVREPGPMAPGDPGVSKVESPSVPAAVAAPRVRDARSVAGRPALARALSVAQLANRYVLLEYADRLELIDQHALHERVLFAKLKAKLEAGATERQRLLVPEPLDLTRREAALLADREIQAAFDRLGFAIEVFGPGPTYALASLPIALAKRPHLKSTIEHTLEALVAEGVSPTLADLAHRVLATIACKAAVKAGDPLGPEALQGLLAEAAACDTAYACPHGRPTTLAITYDQLDRHFGRS